MVNVDKLKKSQADLKKSIETLESSVEHKKELGGYNKNRELEDMVKVSLRQSKKVADKVNYLMDAMIEASEAGDSGVEDALKSIAGSQINLMDEVDALKKRVEDANSVKDLMKSQQVAIKSVNKKLIDLEGKVSQLPDSVQLSVIKKEVDDLSRELDDVESLVMAAPEKAEKDIELVKQDMDLLKDNLSNIVRDIDKVEHSEEELLKKVAVFDTVQIKVGALDGKLVHLEDLVKSGKVERENAFKEQLSHIEDDLKSIEDLKVKVDSVSRENLEERDKIVELMGKLKEVSGEVNKLSGWVDSYPIGEAHEMSFLKQKFEELQESFDELKSADFKREVAPELDVLSRKISGMEGRLVSSPVDLSGVTGSLELIKKKLEEIEESRELDEEFARVYEKIDDLKVKMKSTNQVSGDVRDLVKKIGDLEALVKKKVVVPSSDVHEMYGHVHGAYEKLSGIKRPVSEKHKSNLHMLVDDMRLPEGSFENRLDIRRDLKEIKKGVPKKSVKDVDSLIDSYENVENLLSDYEEFNKGEIEKAKKLSKLVDVVDVKDEELVNHFVEKMPVGVRLKIEDISISLGIPEKELIILLKNMQKQGKVKIINGGFFSKIINRKAHVEKL